MLIFSAVTHTSLPAIWCVLGTREWILHVVHHYEVESLPFSTWNPRRQWWWQYSARETEIAIVMRFITPTMTTEVKR